MLDAAREVTARGGGGGGGGIKGKRRERERGRRGWEKREFYDMRR